MCTGDREPEVIRQLQYRIDTETDPEQEYILQHQLVLETVGNEWVVNLLRRTCSVSEDVVAGSLQSEVVAEPSKCAVPARGCSTTWQEKSSDSENTDQDLNFAKVSTKQQNEESVCWWLLCFESGASLDGFAAAVSAQVQESGKKHKPFFERDFDLCSGEGHILPWSGVFRRRTCPARERVTWEKLDPGNPFWGGEWE